MLRFSLILSLAFAALCAGVPIHAADGSNPSMATVNMKLIFEAHPKTKEAEAQINAERNRLNKVIEEAEAKVQRVRAEIAELDADLAGGKLGNTAQEQTTTIRKEKAAQVQIMEAQVQAAREQSMKDLQKASLRMRDAILDAINSSIAKTPQLDGAGLILDKSGSSMNALPFVLYSSDSLDLSGAVQRRIAGMGARDEINGAAGNGLAVVVVDVKRVFESYSKTREAQERIDQARGTLAKEFEQRLAVATAATETIRKLEEQLADPALSEADRKARTQERSAKALELETMERENAEFRQIREKQMQEQYVRMRDGIADDINVAIAKGVKAEGRVDLIFDVSGTSLNGVPILMRHQGIADWTEPLITRLNITKGDATRVPIEWAGGTTSTAKLRFAVVNLQKVIDSLPEMAAVVQAVERARAEAKAVLEKGGDANAKVREAEEAAAAKRAEVVESVKKQVTVSAVKAGAQVVFDTSGLTLNGVPVVTAREGVPDLSDEVIAGLGGTK